MRIPSMDAKRHLYGFKMSASIRAWIERRRGNKTLVLHELVKPDGALLFWIRKGTRPLSLAGLYATWPDALLAYAVYVEPKEEEE